MQRFILIITDQGLDAVMPISNNPDAGSIRKKVQIMMTFEYGRDPRKMDKRELDKRSQQILDDNPSLKGGGADTKEYAMFDLRFRFAGSGATKYYIGLDKKDMSKIRSSGPKEGAFYILDILITGKTKLGRFEDDSNEETIEGINLNKDWDDEDRSLAKTKRRIFYNSLIKAQDDPDEI